MYLFIYKSLWFILHPLLILLAVLNLPRRWDLRQRLVLTRETSRGPSVWFHCASLGEAGGMMGIIRSLEIPRHKVLITTATRSGSEAVRRMLEARISDVPVILKTAPLDHGPVLRKFINRYSVKALFLYEQEVWPGVIDVCHRQKIPVMLTAARLTGNARRKYRFIQPLIKEAFGKLSFIQAQNPVEQQNLESFTGRSVSPGFDFKLASLLMIADGDLKNIHGDGFAFISLHRAELDMLLPEMIIISEQVPVFIFPRYMKDVKYFYSKLELLGCVKWSQIRVFPPEPNLILIDQMGQVLKQARYYNVCFVGGSFIHKGGHNVWEPFLEGVKVITGPWHYNQRYAVELLSSKLLLHTVKRPEEILEITYEPYDLEAAMEILDALKENYAGAIREIREKLSSVAKNVRVLPLISR